MSCNPSAILPLGLALLVCSAQGFLLLNGTELQELLGRYRQEEPHVRTRRAIPREDREEILRLHNQLRGQVSPPASNMEHMVSHRPDTGAAPFSSTATREGGLAASAFVAPLSLCDHNIPSASEPQFLPHVVPVTVRPEAVVRCRLCVCPSPCPCLPEG